jgi:hypothetical protein
MGLMRMRTGAIHSKSVCHWQSGGRDVSSQCIGQFIGQFMGQFMGQSMGQSTIGQSMGQSMGQSIGQSMGPVYGPSVRTKWMRRGPSALD